MIENIIIIASMILLTFCGFVSGYLSGKAESEAKFDRFYKDLCARIIEALRRRDND